MSRATKAALLAEADRLRTADALIPRRTQHPCTNCAATQVRETDTSCCWNPTQTHPIAQPEETP